MSSNTTPTDDVYIVYIPYGPTASAYPFSVQKDARVRDLVKVIRDDPDLNPHLEKESLYLFKSEGLSIDLESLYVEVFKWLRDTPESQKLKPADRLRHHFTDGPAREDEGKIDVIAVTDSFFDIQCTVYVPYGPRADVYLFSMKKDARAQDLEKAIRGNQNLQPHLEKDSLYLFKYGQLSKDSAKARYDQALGWLRNPPDSEKLQPTDHLKRHFVFGPKFEDGEERIDVIAATDSILESPDTVSPLPDIAKYRLSQLNRMKDFPSPSEGIKSNEKLSQWMNVGHGVHAHLPIGNYGPPTALFHPALARLKERLMHLEQVEEPPAEHLQLSHEFLDICSKLHKQEGLLERDLKRIMYNLIDESVIWQMMLEGNMGRADAAFVQMSLIGQLVLAILELKVLDGIGGNPSLQASLLYAKLIMQSEYKDIVLRSNCPVVLIGIMGTRLEISTAVFTDGVYVDKLYSEDLHVDAWQSETVLRVGRVFKALSLAIAELRQYYQTLAGGPNPGPNTRHLYPDPLPVEGEGKSVQIPQLEYLGKLSHAGRLLHEEKAEIQLLERPYGLYRAKMVTGKSDERVDVVVKFTVRYNEEAHRMLAEKGLAPTLHFCIPLVGGMYMVIMEYAEGAPLFRAKPEDVQNVYEDVAKAVELLHERDLVFGDLRIQNVLCKSEAKGGGAMLIDFDWVGKHKVDRYPASWNKGGDGDGDSKWAPEVDRRVLMDKAHDTYMLAKLKAIVETKAV